MVIVASGIACGRVRVTTATTEFCKIAAMTEVFGQLAPVKTRYPLTCVTVSLAVLRAQV